MTSHHGKVADVPELLLKLKIGRLDKDVIAAIQEYADDLLPLLTLHLTYQNYIHLKLMTI